MSADDSDEMPCLVEIPSKSIAEVLQPIKKDTTGWAEAFACAGIEYLEDLFELTELELREVFTDKDLAWNSGVVVSLRKRVKQLVIGLSADWTFRKPRSEALVVQAGRLAKSSSISSNKSTKPVLPGREAGSALMSPIVPAGLAEFARLLSFAPLAESDYNTCCYFMALYHGLDINLQPFPFEYTGMALALTRLFPNQSERQDINWKLKLHSFWKNWRQGCYPKENPFPEHRKWEKLLLGE